VTGDRFVTVGRRQTVFGHDAMRLVVGSRRHTVDMPYDVGLADRIRVLVAREKGVIEKRMFGGLAFLINGNVAVSARSRGGMILRCDPATSDEHVAPPHVARMVMRGREMDGWLCVDSTALEAGADLRRWVRIGVEYAKSLPSK
jgi:hypothetical protein